MAAKRPLYSEQFKAELAKILPSVLAKPDAETISRLAKIFYGMGKSEGIDWGWELRG